MRNGKCIVASAALLVCFLAAGGALARSAPNITVEPLKTPASSAETPPALYLTPNPIKFTSTDARAEVGVFFGNAPVKSSDITKIAVFEKPSMFKWSKSAKGPGTVLLRTNPETAEDGSYRLEVTAKGQTASSDIFITLPTPADVPTQFTMRPRLELDPHYKKGATLTYKLEAPVDADYTWTVNGATVLRGLGERKLVYTFTKTGPHKIRVVMESGADTLKISEGETNVTP